MSTAVETAADYAGFCEEMEAFLWYVRRSLAPNFAFKDSIRGIDIVEDLAGILNLADEIFDRHHIPRAMSAQASEELLDKYYADERMKELIALDEEEGGR